MLEKFAKAKEPEIARLMAEAEHGRLPVPWVGARPSFRDALTADDSLAVIAEYKRASPSRGDINLGLEPEAVARGYADAGADALSVLTEETYFKGSLEYLHRMAGQGLPLLRKDFLLHPLQVAATAATPASALLVIVRMFARDEDLAAMLAAARESSIEAVVEVFDSRDLERAQAMNADIIQVNNRDLDTLSTHLDISEKLAARKREHETWISASGMSEPVHLARAAAAGYDAVLVGSALMADGDPGAALRRLKGETA